MKLFALTAVTLAATSSFAQLRTQNYSPVEGLRQTRQQMEQNTENSILERLEEARLEDERNRRQQFEAINFSVLSEPAQSSL